MNRYWAAEPRLHDGASELSVADQAGSAVPRIGDPAVGSNEEPLSPIHVSLLTGGDDRPYAYGMVSALTERGIHVDFIGSDKLDSPQLRSSPLIRFINLRGDSNENVPWRRKLIRILTYYVRLLRYTATHREKIFHILWNNRIEHLDRTALMFYYRLFGKRIVLTAHNVNKRKRDGCDNWLNRATLRMQYQLCSHILVHTDAMKEELVSDFEVSPSLVSVIPFGINNTVPRTALGNGEAKERLGVRRDEKVMLFFGQIAPYKGLEYLIAALSQLAKEGSEICLLIAGRIKPGHQDYWDAIDAEITEKGLRDRIISRLQFIPDEETETYFKAADVLVIPYVAIFQSGVPFLSYGFGLPVIATDVGSLRNDIIEGETGFLCRPRDPLDLARVIKSYFGSDLYRNLELSRSQIRDFANDRNSWSKVGSALARVYRLVLAEHS